MERVADRAKVSGMRRATLLLVSLAALLWACNANPTPYPGSSDSTAAGGGGFQAGDAGAGGAGGGGGEPVDLGDDDVVPGEYQPDAQPPAVDAGPEVGEELDLPEPSPDAEDVPDVDDVPEVEDAADVEDAAEVADVPEDVPDVEDVPEVEDAPDVEDVWAPDAEPDGQPDVVAACDATFEVPVILLCGDVYTLFLYWSDWADETCPTWYTPTGPDPVAYATLEALADAEGCDAECLYVATTAVDFVNCNGNKSGYEVYEAGDACPGPVHGTPDGIYESLCDWGAYDCYCE